MFSWLEILIKKPWRTNGYINISKKCHSCSRHLFVYIYRFRVSSMMYVNQSVCVASFISCIVIPPDQHIRYDCETQAVIKAIIEPQHCKLSWVTADYNVQHHNWRIKYQLDATYYFIVLLIGSTCFGHYYAHHQDLATMMLITTLVVSFLVCCMLEVRCG